ncbi:MAG: hypothetical protein ACRDFT_03230 [bacterium]
MSRVRRLILSRSFGIGAAGLFAALAAAGAVWWTRPPAAAITTGQILGLLPSGSTLHSLARLDLDGAPPLEVAAVAGVPRFPGSRAFEYVELIVRYNRWRHRLDVLYRHPVGSIPISVDAGRLLGDREAALFQALRDDRRWAYRVVGVAGGAVTILAEGVSAERVVVADPVLIDRAAGEALAWNGTGFRPRPLPPVDPLPPAVTWRFSMRNGMVVSRTNHLTLRPRQILRVQAVGGGTTPIVIADPRFDVVENGFRARHEGVYAIRVLAAYTPTENAYVLTVAVTAARPP